MTLSRISAIALMLAFATAALAQVGPSGSAYEMAPVTAVPPIAASATIIATPIITFINASNAPVGATNATGGNVAGATNATVNNVPAISMASWTVPVLVTGDQGGETLETRSVEDQQKVASAPGDVMPVFDTGISQPEASIAQAAGQNPRQHATRMYTNADVERQAQQSGVKKK